MIKDNDADTRLGFNFRINNHLVRACIYISVVCIYVMCLKYIKKKYRKKKYSKVPQPFLVWGQTKLGAGEHITK